MMKQKLPILFTLFSGLLLTALFILLLPVQPSTAQTGNDYCRVVLSEWRSGPDMPTKHLEAGTAVIGDKLYVFTGFDTNSLTTSKVIDVYNPETGIWETAAAPLKQMPFAASHIQAAVDGQYVWIAGGYTDTHPGPITDAVWRYDTVSDSWTQGPKLPAKRAGGFLVRVGRSLHYGGGLIFDRDTSMPNHWALDLDNTGAGWQSLPDLPDARNHLSGIAINGRLYAIGGQYFHDHNPIDLKIMHVYDPDTKTWTQGKDLLFHRSHFEPGTFQLGPRAVIVGGRNNQIAGQGRLSEVTVYDTLRDLWYELRELPVDLIAPVAAVLGDQIIVTGGGSNWDIPQRQTYIADISYDCTTEPTDTAPEPTATTVRQVIPLYQPAEGETLHTSQQVFEWGTLNGATEYKVKFKGVSTVYRAKQIFTPLDLVCSDTRCSSVINVSPRLPNKEQILWRVIVKGPGIKGKSEWQHFLTQMPGKATLSQPANGSLLSPAAPVFTWTSVPHATQYKLIVKDFDNNKVLKQIIESGDAACNDTMCSFNGRDGGIQLTTGQNYRWLVKSYSADGKVKSEVWHFKAG